MKKLPKTYFFANQFEKAIRNNKFRKQKLKIKNHSSFLIVFNAIDFFNGRDYYLPRC